MTRKGGRSQALRTKRRSWWCEQMVCSKWSDNSKGEAQQRTYDWDSGRCLATRLHTCTGWDKGVRKEKNNGKA